MEIQVARAGRQPQAAPRRLQGSLGSSASCPGHSAGSVAPAPSQFLEQTEVSTTDLRQPAVCHGRTADRAGREGLCIWGCGRLHVKAPPAVPWPGAGKSRGQERRHGQAPPCGRRGSGDSTADVGGSTGVRLAVTHGWTGRHLHPEAAPWSLAGTRRFCLLPTKPKSGANQGLMCGGAPAQRCPRGGGVPPLRPRPVCRPPCTSQRQAHVTRMTTQYKYLLTTHKNISTVGPRERLPPDRGGGFGGTG